MQDKMRWEGGNGMAKKKGGKVHFGEYFKFDCTHSVLFNQVRDVFFCFVFCFPR